MLLRLCVLVAVLLGPSLSQAAISYVSITNSVTDTVSAASITTADTVNAGESIIVSIQSRGTSGGAAVSTVTWNTSESCTKAKSQSFTASSTWRAELWYCATPTATTANVVVTWASAANNEAQGYSIVHVSGMATSSPVDSTSGAGGAGGTVSSVITTASDNTLIIDSAMGQQDLGLTVGTGQTQRADRILASTTTKEGAGVSTTAKGTAGAETMDWTQLGTTFNWVHAAAAFLPSGGAAPPPASPVQATIRWTNGVDSTGVTTATIKRCQGSCNPSTTGTTLTVVPATNGTSGSYVDLSTAANTTYNWCVQNGDAAGNQSTCTLAGTGATTGTTYRITQATKSWTGVADGADIGTDFDAGYTASHAFTAAKLVSGRVVPTTLGSEAHESYNVLTPSNDQWCQVTVGSSTGAQAGEFGCSLRMANPPTEAWYTCNGSRNTGNTSYIVDYDGTPAALASENTTLWAVGDKLRCEAQGTTLRLYRIVTVNGVSSETLLLSTTDSAHASGKAGIYVFEAAAGTLTNIQAYDWAMGSFTSTPPTPPSITAVTVDATGANVTWNLTTPPTSIRVDCGNNTKTYINDIVPIASFPGGRYTRTWLGGLTFCGFHAIDALGIETTTPASAYIYKDMTAVVPPLDTTPPVVSGCPNVTLPFGTTQYDMSCVIDKPAICAYDAADIAFSAMTNFMTTQSLRCTATLTGLTNGSTTTKYIRAQSVDALDGVYPTTTSQVATIQVLASAGSDTTAPTTVTNLVATPDPAGQTVTLTWTAATDAGGLQGYVVYQSTDGCVTPVIANALVTTTSTQINLLPSTSYCWTVKSIDNANNLAAAMSNQATYTTKAVADVKAPTASNTLVATPSRVSVTLSWDQGSDDSGAVFSSLEQCTIVAPDTDCSNFTTIASSLAFNFLSVSLLPNTGYCFRERNSDAVGNVSAYTPVVCTMTTTTGLDVPRALFIPGLDRTVSASRTTVGGSRVTRP